MRVPRAGSIAGNFRRLAKALRSGADDFVVEAATLSIASIRPLSQTVLCVAGPLEVPLTRGRL
jgi:hypothetical protein